MVEQSLSGARKNFFRNASLKLTLPLREREQHYPLLARKALIELLRPEWLIG